MFLPILLPSLLPSLLLLPTAIMSLPTNPQAALGPTNNRAASTTDRIPVRGDSPAYYNGDPTDDILSIETLDLLPNPPTE